MKLLLFLLIAPLVSSERIVTTTNGPIRGISLAPKKVEAFFGIPYAEPPVGPLRFAQPIPKLAWEETFDASKKSAFCVQASLGKTYFTNDPAEKMSEDCLYLNLWVPEGGRDLKPIMIYIHGGAFMFGSSTVKVYDGATLSEHGGVIVATINYRLGTLGFFYGLTEEAAGSMGMYDQVMAIQWIKDNARQFGGDPDNILLFGESAGSFSTSMHLISPLSKNLFRRAILQSGSSINPMYTNDNEVLLKVSRELASLLGCADDNRSLKKNPKAVVDCMKALPAEKFSEIEKIFWDRHGEIFFKMIIPRVGDAFLPESPVDIFKKGNYNCKEVLIGITRDEGPLLLTVRDPGVLGIFGDKGEILEFNETSAKEYLRDLKEYLQNDKGESDEIIQTYFDLVNEKPGYTYLKAIGDIFGDFLISCGAVFMADYYSLKDNSVYFYLFDYRPDSTPLAEWMGVAHFEDVQYVFGNPIHQEFTEYENEFSRDIMDMWSAFAKSGNPTIPGGVKWPKYTYQDPKYVVLSKKDRVDVRPDNHRCELWRELFQSEIDEDTIRRLKKST